LLVLVLVAAAGILLLLLVVGICLVIVVLGIWLLLQPQLGCLFELPSTFFDELALLLGQHVEINEAEVICKFVRGQGAVQLVVLLLLGLTLVVSHQVVRAVEVELLVGIHASAAHVVV
jgi:hypothetical protein